MAYLLEQLKELSTVVADTGDFSLIRQYQPRDVTTNPSLILKVAQMADYQSLVQSAVAAARLENPDDWQDDAIDRISVAFGVELSKLVSGVVSTEVAAVLSFDTPAMIAKARQLIALYAQHGVAKERVLIKLASTWEGIQAAKKLEQEGIRCNLTLVFNLVQAVAAAEAGVYLISPFVGRIYDWYQQRGGADFATQADPGVASVQQIYHYFKSHKYPTVVMAASFRSIKQITDLSGCDRLTISPALLQELGQIEGHLTCALSDQSIQSPATIDSSEAAFRLAMNNDEMAHEKLAEGIRQFDKDYKTLSIMIRTL
ncbi:MAG: transaldolase [Reinekea forsetii]|uniref:Transaldolase n=1 Tax=Reinekea forsetii TaxID=1336806 RepID=A0A2K8KQ29_9GAMM|nr:transaldolase [Reinekea forsetii]ATX75961.1 transaldolase [Reinekea forsetii]MDO7641165.1 transaldolase [Reinekea forsetii]MDO7645701.1 transaldolase [Reinekea forsetii]MDO7674806.1 transaldolase [Reinekea forsetii]